MDTTTTTIPQSNFTSGAEDPQTQAQIRDLDATVAEFDAFLAEEEKANKEFSENMDQFEFQAQQNIDAIEKEAKKFEEENAVEVEETVIQSLAAEDNTEL